MADTPVPNDPNQKSILNQTLGEILHNNNEAQAKIMQGMGVNQQQFQQLLGQTENNPLMNMTVGELFKSGFIQKAMTQSAAAKKVVSGQQGQAVQMTPEQLQQMMSTQNMQVVQNGEQGQPVQIVVQPQKQSFFQKLKGLFR
jgi:hypothetical protein